MNGTDELSISLAGPGAVGSALLEALGRNGYRILSVISRRTEDSALKGSGHLLHPEQVCEEKLGTLLFLTVPDDRIADTAAGLAERVPNWKGRHVVHCSGALTSGALETLAAKGASVASFHPVQTFPAGSGPELFQGISVSCEGTPGTIALLEAIARKIGSRPVVMDGRQKAIIHLAAVFISNYMVALGGVADRLIGNELEGEGLRLLAPLLGQTAANLSAGRPEECLTGPVSRGDTETVANHLALLQGDRDLAALYRLLGREALRLVSHTSVPPDLQRELAMLFESRD